MNVLPEGILLGLKNPYFPNEFHLFHSSPKIGPIPVFIVTFAYYPDFQKNINAVWESITNRYLNLFRTFDNFTQITFFSDASYIKVIVFISVNEVLSMKKKIISELYSVTYRPSFRHNFFSWLMKSEVEFTDSLILLHKTLFAYWTLLLFLFLNTEFLQNI